MGRAAGEQEERVLGTPRPVGRFRGNLCRQDPPSRYRRNNAFNPYRRYARYIRYDTTLAIGGILEMGVRRSITCFLGLLVAITCGLGIADEIQPGSGTFDLYGLTLGDLEQIARQHNPTLVQGRMAVRAARGRCLQAGLYPNPAIGYAGGDMGLEGTSGQQGAFIVQEIVTADKLRLARNVAGHAVEEALHLLEAQQQRVMNAVRAGYYEVLIAEKMIHLNNELVRIGNEAADVTARLREAQEVSQAEVLQSSIEAERAKLSLFEAKNRHKIAWRQLAAVLGKPQMPAAQLIGDVDQELPVLTWDETLVRLMSQSPELARARAAVQRAQCEVALQRAERRPNIEVEVGAKYDETDYNTLADVSVSIPLKIFDRNQGNILSAQAELVAAQREVDRVELELQNRFAEAFEAYYNAQEQVRVFRGKILPSARASLDLVATGYREGEFAYLSLLTAQLTFFNANLEYLAGLQALWARTVELEGLLLTGGLDPVE